MSKFNRKLMVQVHFVRINPYSQCHDLNSRLLARTLPTLQGFASRYPLIVCRSPLKTYLLVTSKLTDSIYC